MDKVEKNGVRTTYRHTGVSRCDCAPQTRSTRYTQSHRAALSASESYWFQNAILAV